MSPSSQQCVRAQISSPGQTSDEFVRRMWAFFAALLPGGFPHTVHLAALLARISTDDRFQFGSRTFLAGLNAQQCGSSEWPPT